MGKLVVLISTTADGFAASENVIIDEPFFEFTHTLMDESEAILFGRTTFLQFQERWPLRLHDAAAPPFVRKMSQALHTIEKLVCSSRLQKTDWNNTRIIHHDTARFIHAFKQNHPRGLLTLGSLQLVESLIEMNLVDEYYINIQPLLRGKAAPRLFSDRSLAVPQALDYLGHHHLPSGAHVIHYKNRE